MERIAEQDERRVRRLRQRGGKAGDAAAVRLAAIGVPPAPRAVGPSGTIDRKAGTAASACLTGRSMALASTPRLTSPRTCPAMLAADPLAPWAT